jgi:hypothetical protein
MAIVAQFDLKLVQYNVINAFVNVNIDKEVYMQILLGYKEAGKILQLNKALFGLRRSPLLWQRKLTIALISIIFKPVPHKLCCLTKDGILVFFYINNIVFTYCKNCKREANEVIQQLYS